MFMKHYAPNRCLYIQNWGVDCRDATPTKMQCQNIQRALQVFYHNYNFSKSKFAKGDNSKKNEITFLKLSPNDLLIILYQLTKFEAPSCFTFRDIIITNFESPNLQREIIRKQ